MPRKILFSILLLGYTLLFGEMFIRLLAPQPIMPRYVTDHEDGVRQNIPGAIYHQSTGEVGVEIRINEQGFRADYEYKTSKGEDVYRLLLLGDSYFMGYEVELENSFAWQVEEKLKQHDMNVEVINLAVSGFSTAESLVALNRGAEFQPDLVVLQWHSSDPTENIRAGLFESDSELNLHRKNEQYLPGISIRNALMKIYGYRWLIGNSHLYSAVREASAGFVKTQLDRLKTLEGKSEVAPPHDVTPNRDELGNGKQNSLNEALIQAVKTRSHELGADTILFDVPTRINRTEFASALSLLNSEFLEHIHVVSPIDQFRDAAHPEKKLYWELGHEHWTPEGNDIAAEALVKAVMQLKLNNPN